MTINRREALGALALGAGLAGVSQAVADSSTGRYGAADEYSPFSYGVASGDPATDSLLLWTHATLEPGTVDVRWEVATDRLFKRIVSRGHAEALPSRGHTVKVIATGLEPGRTYYYRFLAGKAVSPIGQARTLPRGKTDSLVLVSCCCSMYQGGYFHAYDAIAKMERVDAVIHLGDYIYEVAAEKPDDYGYPTGLQLNRMPQPLHACVTLDDYRKRFAQARTDPKLQAAHARAAWIVCWDDHDLANDDWKDGAQAHNPATDGPFSARKEAAVTAFYEWMPIREPTPAQGFYAINRSFDFGDLASFTLLETRLTARDHQLTYGRDLAKLPDGTPDVAAFQAKLKDPSRRMMSAAQEAWLGQVLKSSVAAGKPWQLIGSGVTCARAYAPDIKGQMKPADWDALNAFLTGYYKFALGDYQAKTPYDLPFGLDSWDGYPAARERMYALIRDAKARTVVLSGDSHLAWVNDLHDDSGKRVAAEFGATSLTAGGLGDSLPPGVPVGEAFAHRNPEVVTLEAYHHGFVRLTLSRTEAVGELIGVSTVLDPTYELKTLSTHRVVHEGDTVSRPIPL